MCFYNGQQWRMEPVLTPQVLQQKLQQLHVIQGAGYDGMIAAGVPHTPPGAAAVGCGGAAAAAATGELAEQGFVPYTPAGGNSSSAGRWGGAGYGRAGGGRAGGSWSRGGGRVAGAGVHRAGAGVLARWHLWLAAAAMALCGAAGLRPAGAAGSTMHLTDSMQPCCVADGGVLLWL